MIVKVVGVVVNQGTIQLYIENGMPHRVPAEAWRVAVVKDKLVPALAKKKVVEFDIETFELERKFEDMTRGRIRLGWEKVKSFLGFRVDQDATTLQRDVKILEGITTVPNEVVIPSKPKAAPEPAKVEAPKPVLPVEKPKHDGHTYGVDRGDDHMVATVGGVRIPGVENLRGHMEHAVATGNAKGLETFLERIAKVIEKRQHSIDELLHFMSRADLPIADDGSIIAYKVLKKQGDAYVDCHTKKIVQRPGSIVAMDESRVDPSRRQECSSGFHIARRGYIGSFSGDVCVIVKIAPEDVIAVPHNEPNKMRVAKYHIIAEIPNEGYRLLRANTPMTKDDKSARLLADVIAGRHSPASQIVMDKGNGETDITIIGEEKQATRTGTEKARALDDPGALKPAEEINAAALAAQQIVEPVLDDGPEIPDLPEDEGYSEADHDAHAAADAEEQECCSSCGQPSDIDPCDDCAAEEDDLADEGDGTEGQDRESYSDDQDRDSYTDPDDGVETVDLTDDELAERNAHAEEVAAKVKAETSGKYAPPESLAEEYATLTSDQKLALQLRAEGKSQREIEERSGVSRKSQWRLAQKGF
ncbi:hypothetical protein RCZAHN_92 [Rhodobacter phage RcZahn]|nr:hypothetical protein RCZAHN_92 [Rhodobacter phage RcZahn]